LRKKLKNWGKIIDAGERVLKKKGFEVSTLTPQSPLDQAILGLKRIDSAFLQKKEKLVKIEVLEIL
jgi:hypothetical protein